MARPSNIAGAALCFTKTTCPSRRIFGIGFRSHLGQILEFKSYFFLVPSGNQTWFAGQSTMILYHSETIFAFKTQFRFGDFPAMFAVHVKDLRDAPDVFTSFKNQVPPRAPILPAKMVGYMGVPENLGGNPPHPLLNWSWSSCSTSVLFEGYPPFADWPNIDPYTVNSNACGC